MQNHPEWFSRDEAGNFTERNGWDDVVDLNYNNNDMRAALIGAMQYWVQSFKIDGFRCDMAHLVPLNFWKTARTACETIKPLFWLAECELASYHEVFDVSYAWDWMHVSEKLNHAQVGINEVYNVLEGYVHYPMGALKLFFTSNHDENSWNGTEYEKYGNAAPSAGQSFVFTLVKNGTPTAITLTISGTSTSASDLTSTLAVTAGDTLNWKVVSSGGTPANAVLFGSFEQLVDPS